jgi:hypothetical protein
MTGFGEREEVGVTRRAPTTSPVMWWSLAGALVLVDLLRVPTVVHRLRQHVPEELSREVGDPHIVELAVRAGAYASLVLVLVTVGLCAVVSTLAETRVLSSSVGWRRVRFGPVFAVTALAMGGTRLLWALPIHSLLGRCALLALVAIAACAVARRCVPVGSPIRAWAAGAGIASVVGEVLCLQ